MHKEINIHNLNIPKDDMECWTRYPKFRWVYNASRLFDAQSIKWSLFADHELLHKCPNMRIDTDAEYDPGHIFIEEPSGTPLHVDVFVLKGEIRHIMPVDCIDVNVVGNIELRINAFVTLHFQKFTGIMSLTTSGNNIYEIHLRPRSDLDLITDSEIIKLIKRIYKKNDSISIIGLTDRVLHESLAS